MRNWALLALVGLLVSWESLGYDWNWDDLHLIRPYSTAELAGTLAGHWDPDGIETAGLRPVTTLFNHARAVVLGEHVVAHRLFLVALFAAYLALLGSCARRLGERDAAVVAAGVLAMTAKNSFYHFVWIADGVHALQGVLCAGALYLLLTYLDEGRLASLVPALALAALAMATREDSLAMVPVLLLVGGAYAAGLRPDGLPRDAAARARFARVAVLLLASAAGYWAWRTAAVPSAAGVGVDPSRLVRVGETIRWTVGLAGQAGPFVGLWTGAAVAAVAATAVIDRRGRFRALLWLAASLLTTTTGYVEARPNLLVFSVPFYTLFLASVAASLAERMRPAGIPLAAAAAAMALAGATASRVQQRSLHPLSADQIARDWEMIHTFAGRATIPEARRARVQARLATFGVTGPDFDFDRWEATLPRAPEARPEQGPFVPERTFMQP